MTQRLFAKLQEMESRRRFAGEPYPAGMVPFPRRLVGQGFFPGGDGLWRDGSDAGLRSPSPYPFPEFGIMFLGNDFGSLKGFGRLGIHENPPTWRHIRRRIALANIRGQDGFFTNAYLGLRTDRTALEDGMYHKEYDEFCGEFLEFQIATQAPRLIVVLGDRPSSLLRQVVKYSPTKAGCATRGQLGSITTTVVQVTHPYSDLNKNEAALKAEAIILQEAWHKATQ